MRPNLKTTSQGDILNYQERAFETAYDDLSNFYWINSDLSCYKNFFSHPDGRVLVNWPGRGARRNRRATRRRLVAQGYTLLMRPQFLSEAVFRDFDTFRPSFKLLSTPIFVFFALLLVALYLFSTIFLFTTGASLVVLPVFYVLAAMGVLIVIKLFMVIFLESQFLRFFTKLPFFMSFFLFFSAISFIFRPSTSVDAVAGTSSSVESEYQSDVLFNVAGLSSLLDNYARGVFIFSGTNFVGQKLGFLSVQRFSRIRRLAPFVIAQRSYNFSSMISADSFSFARASSSVYYSAL